MLYSRLVLGAGLGAAAGAGAGAGLPGGRLADAELIEFVPGGLLTAALGLRNGAPDPGFATPFGTRYRIPGW